MLLLKTVLPVLPAFLFECSSAHKGEHSQKKYNSPVQRASKTKVAGHVTHHRTVSAFSSTLFAAMRLNSSAPQVFE
jgi:hypothetical protein